MENAIWVKRCMVNPFPLVKFLNFNNIIGVVFIRILNLFAGIGGNRTLWGDKHDITAIENNQQIAMIYLKRFLNDKVIVGDAYKYLEDHFEEFDFIWASPPCITHTRMVAFPRFKKKLPDLRLYSIIIFLQRFFKGEWIVENVIPHYEPLIKPKAIVDRHYIWSNFNIKNRKYKKPKGNFKDLQFPILCNLLHLKEDILDDFNFKNWHNHDGKRNILRNCVLPEAGKYILDCITNKKQLSLEAFK